MKLTCLAKTAMSSLKESEEQTSPPATPGSLGVHVANSHFSKTSASSGNKGWLQEGKHSLRKEPHTGCTMPAAKNSPHRHIRHLSATWVQNVSLHVHTEHSWMRLFFTFVPLNSFYTHSSQNKWPCFFCFFLMGLSTTKTINLGFNVSFLEAVWTGTHE